MFLRVSSLRCASHVESNLVPCLPLPRPSTRCGVVNQHERQVVEGLEVGGGRGRWTSTKLPNLLQLPPRSRCRDRPRGGGRKPHPRSRERTSPQGIG